MTENNALKEKDEQPISSLIQQIKDGTVAPETINKELRKRCIEVLQGEGYSVSTMAQIFQKCEKTLKRDIDAICDDRKLAPGVELAKKIIGEFVAFARIHRSYLMRLARSKDASTAEKAQSEFFAFKVFVELIAKLQVLGYLPTKPQAIVGDIFHHVEKTDFDELAKEIIDVENMVDGDSGETIKKDLDKMKIVLGKIKLSEENNQEEKDENAENK